MDEEKYIKLIEIATTEYMDKHHHYWSIYWKFLTGLAFTMSLYVFGEKNIGDYIQTHRNITSAVFILIIILMGVSSFIVMSREHMYLLEIRKRYKDLYAKIGVEPLPNGDLNFLSKCERLVFDKFPIASVLASSLLIVSSLCIILICLSSYLAA